MFWHFEWGRRRLWIFSRILRCFFSAFYVRDFLCVACFEIFNQRFNPTLIMTGDNKQCATIEQYAQVTKLQPWRPPGHVCSLFSHHTTTRGLHQSDLSTLCFIYKPPKSHISTACSPGRNAGTTSDTFTSVHVTGWAPYWYFNQTCHITFTRLWPQSHVSRRWRWRWWWSYRWRARASQRLQLEAALQHSLVCHRWRFSRRPLEIFQPCLWQTKP